MNALTPTHSTAPSIGYSQNNVAVELAKCLALVAPITMTSEQQELWLRAAIDALQDIRGDEVAAVSAELRRSITRPAQIVPKVAELVAERRKRASGPTPTKRSAMEWHQHALEHGDRAAADAWYQRAVELGEARPT